MMTKTTLHINKTVADFLSLNGENLSELARKAFLARAEQIGYSDPESRIDELNIELKKLRKILIEQRSETSLRGRFLSEFKVYLLLGDKDMRDIMGWSFQD